MALSHHPRLSNFGNVLGGAHLLPECEVTFKLWHKSVRAMMQSVDGSAAQTEAVEALFARFVRAHVSDDVEFCPPTYFATYTGKGPFTAILHTVAKVFGKTFTYHRQWLSDDGREWALEFTADGLGGTKKSVRGIDLVSLDEKGHITNFRILAAPPNGVAQLKEEMGKRVPAAMARMKNKQSRL